MEEGDEDMERKGRKEEVGAEDMVRKRGWRKEEKKEGAQQGQSPSKMATFSQGNKTEP